MKCPYCDNVKTAVIDSRESSKNNSIRRRRVCQSCKRRFTTYEQVAVLDIFVIKKNGTKEKFDTEKIKRGILKATFKRPITVEQVNSIVGDVAKQLRSLQGKEVKSWEIGNMVIDKLKQLDQLSYLLFSTIYRDFNRIEDFEEVINLLRSEK